MPITGSRITGINVGAAQVFKPYESEYGEKIGAIAAAKAKEKQKREEEIYEQLGKIKIEGIFYKHAPIFAKKEQEFYDYVRNNIYDLRKGDPSKTIEFRQRATTLATEVGLSKDANKEFTVALQEYHKNTKKYRPDSLDLFDNYLGYDKETDTFSGLGAVLKENINLTQHFRANLMPILKEARDEGQGIPIQQKDGTILSKKWRELTSDDAMHLVRNELADVNIYDQTQYEYKKANPTVKEPTLSQIEDYYYDRFMTPLLGKKEWYGLKAPVSFEARAEAKLRVSPYRPKGKGEEQRGFNVGYIGGGGLKTDLAATDEKGQKEVLTDVDLNVIYNKGTKENPNLRAIVAQYVYEEIPMTDDERKKEQARADSQGIDPVFTKTKRVENPREIDVNVGTNNYEVLISQFPGLKEQVFDPTLKLFSGIEKTAKPKTLPTVNTQAEYDALPKGAKYIDSQGTEATKK